MSVLGNLILILVTAGVTYFAVTSMGFGGPTGPVTLGPDIAKYIDTKLAAPSGGGATAELAKIAARLTEMEGKLTEMEKIRSNYEQLAGKSELIESAIGDQRRRKEELMQQARSAEMAQLRNDIATVCAGVTIKRVDSSPGKGTNPDAAKFRQNIGVGAGQRPGVGNQPPAWMQNMRQGQGGGRRRGGGGGGGGAGAGTGDAAPGGAPAAPAPAPAPAGATGGQNP